MASGHAADEDLEVEEEAVSVEIRDGKLSLRTNSASITTRSLFISLIVPFSNALPYSFIFFNNLLKKINKNSFFVIIRMYISFHSPAAFTFYTFQLFCILNKN